MGDTNRVSSSNNNLPLYDRSKQRISDAGRNTSYILKKNSILFVILILLISLAGGLIGGLLVKGGNDLNSNSLSGQKKIVTSTSNLISQIAKTVGVSVVSVNVNVTQTNTNSGLDFFGFGNNAPSTTQLAGTGIIISNSGIIITNRHVVPEGTSSVSVTLSNGTELKDVSVIGRTSSSSSLDIAFLKINDAKGEKLTPAILGDSSQVQVGDAVVAIGNALGQFQNTVTSGIISGYGRSITASSGSDGSATDQVSSSGENLEDLFQTDAAINEGNSGGPLVNLNGQVIGINTAIAGNAQNIGFSIPVNDIIGLVNQVLKNGKFSQPYLGVKYITLTPDVAKAYNEKLNYGALVSPEANSVASGSPAESAGIKPGDIITQVEGRPINQSNSLTGLLDQYTPDTNITLSINRSGQTFDVKVKLGSFDQN